MIKPYRFIPLTYYLATLVSACSTPLRIQSDVVPAESLRVAQVVYIFPRQEILKAEAYKSIIATGISDTELVEGSIVMARIYCCGGTSFKQSAEFVDRRMLYVPKPIKVEVEDFVEVKVGRSPENGDKGALNTVIRIVARNGDNSEQCWWEPKNPKLWLRVPYCDWMPEEGWSKQEGLFPAWYKLPN